jgi:hypothetical protein
VPQIGITGFNVSVSFTYSPGMEGKVSEDEKIYKIVSGLFYLTHGDHTIPFDTKIVGEVTITGGIGTLTMQGGVSYAILKVVNGEVKFLPDLRHILNGVDGIRQLLLGS